MTKEDIKETVQAFKKGAERAKEAGFDIIEIAWSPRILDQRIFITAFQQTRG